jgi:hypothetical protein
MRTIPWAIGFCFLGLATGPASGQPATPARPGAAGQTLPSAEARCQRELREYVETMRFIRQSAGDQTGDRVAARYIPEAELQRVAAAQGVCAAAQLIREKSASR